MLLNKKTKTFLSLIFCLFLSVNLCFAATKISKKDIPNYQIDMGKALEKIVNGKNTLNNKTYKDYMNDLYQQDFTWYKTVYLPNKNQMKRNSDYADIIMSHSGELQSLSECFWQDIEPVITKYNLKMDEKYNYFDYLYQYYLKPYNIDLADEFMALVQSVQPNQYKLLELRTEIVNYSRAYEEKKAENFYNKYIASREQANEPQFLGEVLIGYGELNTKDVYISRPEVLQIFPNGFLADIESANIYGYSGVIYVRANDSRKLMHGDCFDPFLPLKFTGTYFYYNNRYGENRKAPIFTIVFPMNNHAKLPQIQETFYFATKPTYTLSKSNYYINSISVINERRATARNYGNPYMLWR